MLMTIALDKQWKTWNAVQAIAVVILSLLIVPGCGSVHLCSRFDEKCVHEDCLISTPCHHGDCDVTGNCICDPCWRGENCNHYIDEYLPTFPSTSETVIIKDPWVTGSIYTVRAFDGDFGTTCPLQVPDCECAKITYSLQKASHPGVFSLNNATGEIFIVDPNRVMAGIPHRLVLAAKGAQDTGSYSTLELFIYWRDDSANGQEIPSSAPHQRSLPFPGEMIFQSVDDDDQLTLRRKKRDALGTKNNHLTMFNLTLMNGNPSTLEIGEVLDYRLDITVPPTEQVDIILELFTKDVGNPNYTPILILYNLVVHPLSSEEGMKYLKGEPNIKMILSDQYDTVYDAALIDFGMISNPGPSDGMITVTFSVTMIRHDSIETGNKYLVTAGAEYDDESYVWVGQSEVIAKKLKPPEEVRDLDVVIHGPSEVALDSAGVFTLDCYLSFRSDSVTLKVTGPPEEDIISIGNLGVKAFGSHYAPVPQSVYHYRTTKTSSESNHTFTEAVMAMGLLTNVGSVGNPVKHEGNKLTVTFAAYALNKVENIGKTVTLTASIDIGDGIKEWSEKIEFTLTPRQKADKLTDSVATIAKAAPQATAVGHLTVLTVQTTMVENSYADYRLSVEVPVAQDLPLLEPCYGQMRKDLSGFNVPFVNVTPVLPMLEGNRYIFNFGRIQVTDQRSPSISEDNFVIVEIIVKLVFHPENVEGSSPELSVAVDNTGKLLSSVQLSIGVKTMAQSPPPPIKVKNASPWIDMYASGGVALEILMQIPPEMAFSNVKLQAVSEHVEKLPRMHICRLEINYVGTSIPCTYLHRMNINENATKYKSIDTEEQIYPNQVLMSMGDVSSLPAKQKREIDGQIILTLITNILDGTPFPDGSTYPVSIDMMSSEDKLWSQVSDITIKTGKPPDLVPEKAPVATAHLLSNDPVPPGFMTEAEILVKIAPESLSSYTFEVDADDEDISVCGVWIKQVGRNMPCVDVETKASYKPHQNPHNGNKIGILAFNAIANVGKHPMEVNVDEHENDIVVTVMIRIGPNASKDKSFTWALKYGSSGEISDKITVPVLLDASSLKEEIRKPKSLNMYRVNSTSSDVGIGVPVLLSVDFELEPNAMAPVTVKLLNPQAESNMFPYDVCLGGVMFVGKNFPCYSAVQLQSNITSSNLLLNNDVNDVATFDMGVVCNTLLEKDAPKENMVRLGIVFRPVDNGHLSIGTEFGVETIVKVGDHIMNMPTLSFTAVDLIKQTISPYDGYLKPFSDEPTPIEIRQRLWIPFNLSIPRDATVRITAQATSPQTEDRSVLTIHGIRVTGGGVNIPCPIPKKEIKVNFESTFGNSQHDKASAFLGYYSNFGFTHLSNSFTMGDDDLWIEVEVEMTDHPLTDHNSEHMLSLSIVMGTTTLETQHALQVVRNGKEKADLETFVQVDSTQTYQRGDTVTIGAVLWHGPASRAEPSDVTFRFFLPTYMTFTALTFTNATGLQAPSVKNATPAGLDITFPYLLFHDIFAFNITLVSDPENQRGYGKGEIMATTPYRVLCHQFSRAEPVQNPSQPDLLFSCSSLDHIQYETNSEECYEPLGLEDESISDCQITASSAATKDTTPQQVRLGSKGVWAPAVRPGFDRPYLQIDFLRSTRVTKLLLKSHSDYRRVTKYSLMYSNTGKKWFKIIMNGSLHYSGDVAEDNLRRPLQGRYLRFFIEEASDNEKQDESYIGVKMELFGCYLSEEITGTCSKDATWYTDKEDPVGRHFAVDTTRDIVYFCDSPYGPSKLSCFSSIDGGLTWNVLTKTVHNLLGYDSESGRTYASGWKGRSYLASEDGFTWFSVLEKEYDEAKNKDSFQPRINIPSVTKPDFKNLHLSSGNWKATYDGLHYKDAPTPAAKWTKCCTKL